MTYGGNEQRKCNLMTQLLGMVIIKELKPDRIRDTRK